MRLDKFLKVSRLIKRRTVANEACDNSRISVNGKAAKASYDIKLGDEITVEKLGIEADQEVVFDKVLIVGEGADIKIGSPYGSKSVIVRVLDIRETTKKSESQGMYEVISETNA